MEEQINSSPVPQKVIEGDTLITFPQAIKEVIEGKKITRIEWNNKDVYGLLKDGFLMIRINNEFKQWIVNDGDLLAEDWIALTEQN